MSHFYVYIKTPPVDNNNTIAHIVEHCALNRDILSIENFYRLCDVESEIYLWYTRYDIPSKIDVDQFIKFIFSPLDKKVFQRELLAFKEETKEKRFIDVLKNKVEKFMMISTSKKSQNLRNNVVTYHKKYYTTKNIVICDADYNIIKNNISITSSSKRSLNISKQAIVSIDWEKNKITILPYTHWQSQVLLYFLVFLYDTYMEYTQRRIQWVYNFSVSCMLELSNYIAIAVPQNSSIHISPEFLQVAKNHFCEVALDEYARKITIINLLYIWQLPTDKEIKTFIEWIDMDTVKKIIE